MGASLLALAKSIYYLLVAQVAFKSVAGTGQENPTANSSEKIRNVS